MIFKLCKKIAYFTPTYLLYRWAKKKFSNKNSYEISLKFDECFLILAMLLTVVHFVFDYLQKDYDIYLFPFLIIQISRNIEIPFAFLSDAVDKLKTGSGNTIGYAERIELSILVYFEILLNYALIYTLLSDVNWEPEVELSMLQSIYFSVITLTTLGYGDICPTENLSRILCVFEVMTSMIIIVISVAIYSRSNNESRDVQD
jgi:voltage-gated potassium channel